MLYTYLNDPAVASDPTVVHSYSKEMGLTSTEFKRTLPKAVKGKVHIVQNQTDRTKVQVVDGARRASIQYKKIPNHTVGSLSLPRLQVDIGLSGFTQKQAQAFVQTFDRAFLRMGGG